MVIIRQAERRELKLLNEFLPTNIPNFHEQRVAEQECGDSNWLIAWMENIPVGHLQIRWNETMIEAVGSVIGVMAHNEMYLLYG